MGRVNKLPKDKSPLPSKVKGKFRKIKSNTNNKVKINTRSVAKLLNKEASIDFSQVTATAASSSNISRTLDDEFVTELPTLGRTRIISNHRPDSRPLLSSTRSRLDDNISSPPPSDNIDNITAIVNRNNDVNDVSQDAFLSLEESELANPAALESAADEAANLVAAEVSNFQLSTPHRKVSREVWEVAKHLSCSGSPTRLAAALHIVADAATSDNTSCLRTEVSPAAAVTSPTTSESLAQSVELPATPASPPLLSMAAADQVAAEAAGDIFVEASLMWEEIGTTDLASLHVEAIQQLAADADSQKKQLTSAYMKARKLPVESLVEIDAPKDILDLKEKFLKFRDKAWKQIGLLKAVGLAASQIRLAPADPAAAHGFSRPSSNNTNVSTPEDILVERVNSRKEILIDGARGAAERLRQLINMRPANHSEFIELEAKLEIAATEAVDMLTDIKDLSGSATRVGDADAARCLLEAGDDLTAAKTAATNSVRGARYDLGIPAGEVNRHHQHQMKAPFFKGDFKEKLDFYTFERELVEYLDAAGYRIHSDKLVKLRNDCLGGSAKDVVVNAKTYQEAMDILKDFYAKPLVLLALKTKEIKDIGSCPEAIFPRQAWCIKVVNKLKYVMELCEDHNEIDFITSSDLTHQITYAMQKKDREKFDDKIVKATRRSRTLKLTRNVIAEELVKYLDDLIEELGFTLNYRITNSFSNTEDMLKSLQLEGRPKSDSSSRASQSSGSQSSSQSRRLYVSQPGSEGGEVSQPSQYSGTSSGFGSGVAVGAADGASGPKLSKRQKRKNRAATPENEAAAAQLAMGAAALLTPANVHVAAPTDNRAAPSKFRINKSHDAKQVFCKLCQGTHDYIVYCKVFREALVHDRWSLIMSTSTCYRCLRMDSGFICKEKAAWFKEHSPYCNDRFVCRHGLCAKNEPMKQNHIAICRHHEEINKDDHAEYWATVDKDRVKDYPRLFFMSTYVANPSVHLSDPVHRDAAQPAYMLQYIPGQNGNPLLLFFDTGCMGAVISDRAYSLLDTVPGSPGPVPLEVAGGQTVNNPYGYERFKLAKVDGELVEITALRMVEATSELPTWNLKRAWQDVAESHVQAGGKLEDLPTCPSIVGGAKVDVMIGIEYLSCFPDLIHELEGGLRLYKSRLRSHDGHLGVMGGPHNTWSRATAGVHMVGPRVYFTQSAVAVTSMYHQMKSELRLDMPCMPDSSFDEPENMTKIQCTECHCWEDIFDDRFECGDNQKVYACFKSISSEFKKFQAVEDIGGSIEYRCIVCRNCHACKNSDQMEEMSLQEEKEQAQIESCVRLDAANKTLISKLPFIKDPEEKLKPNRRIAEKILQTQIRIINKTPGMRESVVKAHNKLRDKNHVVKLADLPPDVQKNVQQGSHYFIPWRTVINLGSLSTPRRVVFDASSRTPGGESLNDILARGMNKLGKLLHLLVKFRFGSSAFSADIQMAYNCIKLDPGYYKYQQYLWKEGLTDEEESIVMIVCTVIYGVKPSGNLTIAGFQKVVEAAKELGGHYVIGAICLDACAYMDDIFSAHPTRSERNDASESLQEVLKLGNMSVKAITKSGEAPPDAVTADGVTVGVVGYKWGTVEDRLSLDIKPITLEKTKRGQPGSPIEGDIASALKDKFTKRVLAGRCASVFDPLGLCTPITGQLKVDMSCVCKLAEGWDSFLPEEMIPTWVKNLEQIRQISEISVPRNVGVRRDGEFCFEMVVCVDASENLACAAVYARTMLEPGRYDCNLIMAKSKLSNKCTIPKGEMRAATLGAGLANIIRLNLGQYISREYFITDSTISLCWLHQDQRPLQNSVRNSVIHVRRLSNLEDWYHTPSEENPADIGTRPVTVNEIKGESDWFKGRPWMRGPPEDFPVRQISDLKLTKEEEIVVGAEIRSTEARGMVLMCKVSKVGDRYKYSNYLVDPCSRPWPKFLRLMATVCRCVQIWRRKLKRYEGKFPVRSFEKLESGNVLVNLEFQDLEAAKIYIFRKTTKELKYFNNRENYIKLGETKNGIFVFTGRIMDGAAPKSISGAMLDLGPLTFCQPVIDRYSPVAYSIMFYVHNTLNHHGGIKSTYRRSLEIGHIMKGLALSEEIREACTNCKRYKVRLMQAELGKIHQVRFTPAPPFYFVQSDLAGPWEARCENHARVSRNIAPVKIWAAVFKCCTTLAIAVEVMTDYSASSYIDAYIRFSSRYGHTGVMFIDPGANLKSACEKMTISLADISKTINGKGVEMKHEVCVTGSHESQGLVERSIREIRRIYTAVFRGFKLSVMGYQTAFTFIANELNNVPLCLGGNYKNLDHLDLITPNRLLLGRNNQRAPVGLVQADTPSVWMETMEDVSKSWWSVWESEWLVNLIPKPSKWMSGEPDVAVGDICVFLKEGKEAELGQTPWRTGRVEEVHAHEDGVIRSLTLKYQNHNEEVYRYTRRSVRTAAVVHREGVLDLLGELSLANVQANKHFLCNFNFVST